MTLDITNGTGAQTLDIKQPEWQDRGWAVVGDVSAPGSGALAVTINTGDLGAGNAALSVASGDALVNGATASFGGGTVDIPAARSDPRKDVVWIDATGTIRVDTGQPAQRVPDNASGFATWTPAIPFPSTTPATVLAAVYVPANTATIDAGTIQDRRLPATTTLSAATVQDELRVPIYGDNTNAVQANRSVWYNDGSGPDSSGYYAYDNGTVTGPLGSGGSSEWQEDGSGNLVPIDGETVGDGTTSADHQSLSTGAVNNNGSAINVQDPFVDGLSSIELDAADVSDGESVNLDAEISADTLIGFLFVSKVAGGTESGIVELQGAGDSVNIVFGANFSTTAGNSNTVNVYHDGSNYILENNSSGTVRATTYIGRN